MSDALVGKIARLLGSEEVDRQIAAAIVLGELGVRDAGVIEALRKLLAHPLTPVQRHALAALGALRARKALPAMLPLLSARDESLRTTAVEAIAALGDEAVPAVRAALQEKLAAPPAERRPYEELLGRLGGQDALATMLASLAPDDLEGARAVVLPLRQRLRAADGRERKRAEQQARKWLAGSGNKAMSPAARLAAVKLLGYLEERTAVPLLLAVARGTREPTAVREEAVIALRLALGGGAAAGGKPGKVPAPVVAALVGLAADGPAPVARAALYSLVGLPLTPALLRRIGKLTAHAEAERALIAVELLGRSSGPAAADLLATVLLQTGERARAEAAAKALGTRPEAAAALARALLASEDRDRTEMLVRLLRPQLGSLERALGRQLIARAAALVEAGDAGADALVPLARALDAERTAGALRALAGRLRSRKPVEALRVLRALGRSREAAAEDGYALGALELTHGLKDEAFTVFGQLLDQGFDVAAALRKDRAVEARHRYEIGFHFIERGHPLGEEVLQDVAQAAGRSKLGQMARAKLKSAGFG